ncbi:MAG: hypothetical protein Q9161_009221 [Pseudevernia consocians]
MTGVLLWCFLVLVLMVVGAGVLEVRDVGVLTVVVLGVVELVWELELELINAEVVKDCVLETDVDFSDGDVERPVVAGVLEEELEVLLLGVEVQVGVLDDPDGLLDVDVQVGVLDDTDDLLLLDPEVFVVAEVEADELEIVVAWLLLGLLEELVVAWLLLRLVEEPVVAWLLLGLLEEIVVAWLLLGLLEGPVVA